MASGGRVSARSAIDGVVTLRAALRDEGGTVASLLADEVDLGAAPERPGPAQRGSSGPRAVGNELEYELLLEMILEGSRLHYGPQRVVRTDDADLALLVGDQLYALGLSRLAELGDLEATGELADLISLVAQAHSCSDRELADAVWEAGASAVGWGSSAGHTAAKELARAGEAGAAGALLASVRNPG
jgi:hypothetical protein